MADAAITAMMSRLTTGAASDVASTVKTALGANACAFRDAVKAVLEDKKATAPAVVGAINGVKEVAAASGAAAVPFLVDLVPGMLERMAEKPDMKAAAEAACAAVVDASNKNSVGMVLPALFESAGPKKKWQTRVGAFNLLSQLSKNAPVQTAAQMGEIVPKVAEGMGDARAEVRTAAEACFVEVLKAVGNRDIEPFCSVLISALARPSEVPEAVHRLSSTTFVQAVESPALAVMVPILFRGLGERVTRVKRQCCVIIENMCKLVPETWMVAPFVPKLLPGLAKAKEEVSDPECRNVAVRAFNTLLKAAGETEASAAAHLAGTSTNAPKPLSASLAITAAALNEAVSHAAPKGVPANQKDAFTVAVDYVAALGAQLVANRVFSGEEWNTATTEVLTPFLGAEASKAVADAYLARCFEDTHEKGAKNDQLDDDPGEDLCNCEFSLAYGGKILLNTARLHLKTGRRYGLCGHNGCGKSTLMRAIANGQVEGFPSGDELRTVYVEHDIQGDVQDVSVTDYVLTEPRLAGTVDRAEVEKILGSVGFTDSMRAKPITSLSGGWKMKLALARAMLLRAQIMLLDEPTNHLDVTNVAWLVNYLTKEIPNVTCMIVSHDAGFLDKVCTDIIHYESFKLKRYRGNLSQFIKSVPEARSYYDLAATPFSFHFPEPGFLEGVKTMDRAILKMSKIGFSYPIDPTRKILHDVSLSVSLSSRVMVTGANGAGKSTAIKILTGELETNEGTTWKHPNLRIAYVAQHAFHHLEQHLDKTPAEYIMWRYAAGEDKEALKKASSKVTAEEEAAMKKPVVIDGVKMVVQQLLGRRKLRNSYEYEVQWVGMPMDKNMWMSRSWLEEQGFGKMVDALDAKEAAQAGLMSKPLTSANIAKHLEAVGLDQEFTLHHRMRGLSGGQKVKVVLGACTWNQPHVIVMDEPTNYLDRDSLGALAQAIREFKGGVVLISHNAEFVGSLCQETWHMENGRLTVLGQSWKADAVAVQEQPDEITDAAGNTVKIAKKAKVSAKDAKKKAKERAARKARGEDVTDSEEEA